MASRIEPLLQPLTIRSNRLPNRIVMAPMSRYFSPGGIPTADVASYYSRRAATGIGLIVTEGIGVAHAKSVDRPGTPVLHGREAIAGWKRVIDAVHAAGGLIWTQLWHQGPMWSVEYEGGRHAEALRPSGIWGPPDGTVSIALASRDSALAETAAMSESEISDVIEGYRLAARNARAAGADGIAIHGAHGYLIDTFLWGYTNRRTDRWGGNARARAEFGCAVVRAIREEVGEATPIALRFSQFKMQDYSARLADTPDELGKLLGPLADAGVDLFDGSQRYFDTPIFESSPLNLAGWAKTLTGKPSMTVGGVGLGKARGAPRHIDDRQRAADNLPLVLARFERGEFDLVGVGRSILNDPAWFSRARQGEAFLPFDPANLDRLT